jgi:hypothetical protein
MSSGGRTRSAAASLLVLPRNGSPGSAAQLLMDKVPFVVMQTLNLLTIAMVVWGPRTLAACAGLVAAAVDSYVGCVARVGFVEGVADRNDPCSISNRACTSSSRPSTRSRPSLAAV